MAICLKKNIVVEHKQVMWKNCGLFQYDLSERANRCSFKPCPTIKGDVFFILNPINVNMQCHNSTSLHFITKLKDKVLL